jgi:hypothetical protein
MPEGKTPLRIPRFRNVNNFKMDLGVLWTELVWLRMREHWRAPVHVMMDLRVP